MHSLPTPQHFSFFFFFFPLLFLSPDPLAHILHYDKLDDPMFHDGKSSWWSVA